ncbi:hypothetical protein ACFVT1_03080 [Streptomyces sp. NPDC057963]|uniref:hypothetical protein n=1 Tax=Streptomyces sp. NPDC057963 TaxID=3346290 RepID=UPI0036E33B70
MESYTPAEKRERNRLFRKGFRQALADCVDPRLEARIEKIDQRAAERGAQELRALHQVQADARQTLANAKATERTAARQARKQAEDAVRRAERAVARAER